MGGERDDTFAKGPFRKTSLTVYDVASLASGEHMRRRELIKIIFGVAGAWPLAAHAQQPTMPVIGFLHSGSAAQNTERLVAFRKGLNDGGFVEGRNITIEFRWADGHYDRLPAMAADLIDRHVAVIATPLSTPAALAAKAATTTIPIVFATGTDPVVLGLVASLNRPGGNVTGITSLNSDLAAKRLGLLRSLVPQAQRFFVLINPEDPLAKPFMDRFEDRRHGHRHSDQDFARQHCQPTSTPSLPIFRSNPATYCW